MKDFIDSMPLSYARSFGVAEVAEHADIVSRRGAQLAHAEIWAGQSGSLVCVVADDRPGLLALVTDALLVHGLSIRSAQVYCRRRPGGPSEAVDFFQLQQPKRSAGDFEIEGQEISAFVQTLSELVAEHVLATSRSSAPPPKGGSPTRVYFELEALRRGEFVLLVEASDSDGLLNAITNSLHDQSVRILASEIRTEDGLARDRFDLESRDEEPLSAVRLCDIQQAVLAALHNSSARR